MVWLHANQTQGSVALLLHNGRKWWQRYGNLKASGIYNVSKHFVATGVLNLAMMDPDNWLVFFLTGNTGTKPPVLQESKPPLFSVLWMSSKVMEDSSQGWHRKRDQLELLRDVIGWERCFSTCSGCSRATSCSPDFPHPLSFLPPAHPPHFPPTAWGLYHQTTVLRDPGQANSFTARWQAPTSARKQLNPNAPLQSALSRPWSPTAAAINRRTSAQIDHPSWTLIFVEAAHTRTLLPHSNAAHQHSLRHAGERENALLRVETPTPLSSRAKIIKRTHTWNSIKVF